MSEREPEYRRLTLTRASDIAPLPVHWLWAERLALGVLALLAGREGIGKSLVTAWLISAITRGALPGESYGHPRGVIIAATEDSWAHTIVPRLLAAGADLERVYRADVVINESDIGTLSVPRDLAQLADAILAYDVALVLLDPLLSRLSAQLDSHKDAEVRMALEPLVRIADQTRCVVLGIIHVNKTSTTDPLNAVMGSRAFTAVARAVLFAMVDPESDGTARLLGQPKNNLGRHDLATLLYRLESWREEFTSGPISAGRVVWLGESDVTIGDALDVANGSGELRTAIADAVEWLRDYLTARGGTEDSAILRKAARAAGHSQSTLYRARERLRIRTESVAGFPRPGTFWTLPDPPVFTAP